MTDVKTAVVPVEPTEAMILAGERAAWDDSNTMPAIRAMPKAWAAMLAAAPAPLPGGLEDVARLRAALQRIADGYAGCDDFQDAQAVASGALQGSRPPSPVVPTEQAEGAVVGRFGHHPDHIIDYSVEVECIQSMVEDYGLTGQAHGDDDKPVSLEALMHRIWKANGFRVGVVPEALSARRALVECINKMEPIYAAAHHAPTPASVSPGTEGETKHRWAYCPECGSDHIRHEEGAHKQCGACLQEWFSDIDYSDVVQKNLARLHTASVSPAEQVVTEPAGRSAPNLDAGVVGDLVEALSFYADEDNWYGVYAVGAVPMVDDWQEDGHPDWPDGKPGAKARAALAKYATQGTGGAS